MKTESAKSHIVFMGTSTHLGGAERSLLDFLKMYSQDPERENYSVLFPKSDGPLIETLKSLDISVFTLKWPELFLKSSRSNQSSIFAALIFNFPQLLIYFFRLLYFFGKHRVTHVHSTGIKCHVLLCLASPFVRTKITIHFRDSITHPRLRRFFALFKNQKNIAWVSASKFIQATAPELPMMNIYDGFDDEIFSPQRGTFLKKQLGLPFGTPLVVLMGVVARWKGQKEFIEAAQKVVQAVPRVHFAIVGEKIYDTLADGDYYEEILQLAKTLGLEDRVHFVRFQKHPEVIYNSVDLLVHCSIAPEPFGRVIVEAMLCKTPVIASRAGGVLEIVEDNVTGFLHEPGNVRDLARKIRNCLLKEGLQDPTTKAHEFAKSAFNLRKQYDAQKKVFLR